MDLDGNAHITSAPVSGWMDVQLPLSPEILKEPPPVSHVTKRDGRKERFDASKIESSIQRALLGVGNKDRDLPRSLASGVVLFLNRHQVHAKPNVNRVRSAVERALRAMGEERAAGAYAHHPKHSTAARVSDAASASPMQMPSLLPADAILETLADAGSPEANARQLTERVKAAYALEQFYGQEVAEEIRDERITIPNLARFDSLSRLGLYPERLKRVGLETGAPEWRRSGPGRKIDEILGQLAGQTEIFFRYVSDVVAWEAVNLTLAPYVLEYDEATLRDVARVLLMEFAYRRTEDPDRFGRTQLGLVWNVPAGLASGEAIGPGGVNTGHGYGYYEDTARRFALAILEVQHELGEQDAMMHLPELEVTLPYDAGTLWEAVCRFEGEGVSLRLEEQGLWLPFETNALSARSCVANRVIVDLHDVGAEAADMDDAFHWMDRLMERAAAAHNRSAAYFKSAFDRGEKGPMGLLSQSYRRAPMLPVEQLTFQIEIAGLREGIDAFLRGKPESSLPAHEMVGTWLRHLQGGCHHWSKVHELSIELAPVLVYSGSADRTSEMSDYGSHGTLSFSWESNEMAQRVQSVRDLMTSMPEGCIRLQKGKKQAAESAG